MKKVKIYESEIKRAVRRKLMENILSEEIPSKQDMEDRTEAIGDLTNQYKELQTVMNTMKEDSEGDKEVNEEFEMKDTYSRKNYRQSPREKDIESVFGQYSEEIPPSVLRYMRKNPEKIVKRLYDIYGQQMFDYISPNLPDNPQYEVSIEDIVRENMKRFNTKNLSEQDKKDRTKRGSTANNPMLMQFFLEEVVDNETTGKVVGGTLDAKNRTIVIEIEYTSSYGNTFRKFLKVSADDLMNWN